MSHHQLADLLRRLGLIAQLVGLATTAWGIHATRKQFDPAWRPLHVRAWPPVHRFLNWLVNYPPPKPENIVIQVGPAESRGRAGSVEVVVSSNDLSRRVELLEETVRSVRDDHRRLEGATQSRLDELAQVADRERADRELGLRKVEDRVVRLATGGVRLSAWGVTLLASGVVLSTVPSGVANAIGR